MKNIIIAIVIILLVGYIVYDSNFNTHNNNDIKSSDTVLVIDTVIIIDTFTTPPYKPETITIIQTIEVPVIIDTQALIMAYYSKNHYLDTLIDDSLLFISVSDTIYNNLIYSRVPEVRRKSQIITKEKIVNTATHDNGIYLGGYVGQSFGVSIDYKYKYNVIGVSYGNNGLNVNYRRKLNIKIFK